MKNNITPHLIVSYAICLLAISNGIPFRLRHRDFGTSYIQFFA